MAPYVNHSSDDILPIRSLVIKFGEFLKKYQHFTTVNAFDYVVC